MIQHLHYHQYLHQSLGLLILRHFHSIFIQRHHQNRSS
jgi:hypothetical protein